MNVFGRNLSGTAKVQAQAGRDHFGNHAVMVMIGKNVAAGVTGGVGGLLGGGLGELLERFKQTGLGEIAQSWINDGPNKEIAPPQLKQAIGADVLAVLEKQTGLSQDELLARLSRELPAAVDKYTPDGLLPDQNA